MTDTVPGSPSCWVPGVAPPEERCVVRIRHRDSDLLELARAGSAPAFASLLHRHRDIIHRGALRAEHPERVVEAAMVATVRDVRRDRVAADDLRGWLDGIVDRQVQRDPGRPGVERFLPGDWFDRAWVRAERTWPSGRRRVHVPRWVRHAGAAVVLALASAGVTYLVVTADVATEVITELIAEPIDDPDVLVVPGPVVDLEPEEAPELFGDVELGELPTYDLTGAGDRVQPSPPTLGPNDAAEGADDGDGDDPGDDDS